MEMVEEEFSMMQVTDPENLQIFLTTYNRPKILRQSIVSVLRQTMPVKRICVLDNGYFEETKEMLSDFKEQEIDYVDTRSLGLRGNLLKAQQLAKQEYVLLLHDDDLLHPEHLEISMRILKARPELNLLTYRTKPWVVGIEPSALPPIVLSGHLFDQKEYANFVYNAGHPSYSLAIYRSSSFRELPIEAIFERFGKWGDMPLMVEAIGRGRAAFIDCAGGWMGLHPRQDTNDSNNLPSYRSWIERELFFRKLLGDNPFCLSGLSFCLMNYRHLRSGYKRRVNREVSFRQYLMEARSSGALTSRGEWFRWISFGIVQKIFEGYLRKRYRSIKSFLP